MKRHGSNNINNNVYNNISLSLSLSLSSLNWIVYFLVMFVVVYAHCSSYYAQIIRNHYWIHTLTALLSIITLNYSLTAWLKQKSLAWIMHTILFMRVPLEVVPKKDSGNNTVGNDWGHSPYAALGLGKFLLKKGCKYF